MRNVSRFGLQDEKFLLGMFWLSYHLNSDIPGISCGDCIYSLSVYSRPPFGDNSELQIMEQRG